MRIRPWTIGIFIVGGFALFTSILFLIGSRQNLFERHFVLYTEFANLNALQNGSKVLVSGVDAGEIKKVEIPNSPAEKFRLELRVKTQVHALIRQDSIASIETAGVVGDKYLLITKGTPNSEEAPDNSTLRSKEPFNITAMMEKSTALLDDVHGSINEIRGRVDTAINSISKTVDDADGMITEVRPRVRSLATRMNVLVADLNDGKGAAGLLLKDETTRQQVQETMQNVTQASANVDQVSLHADQLVTDFQSKKLAERMQATLDNAQSLSHELDEEIRKSLAEDDMGQEGAANIRGTLSNLNRSTANLAQDTEALKHNLLFRGFFKKRGFYSLDQLTRADYENATKKLKAGIERKWFEAQVLFITNSDGKEQLSEQGRNRIDQELSLYLDRLGNSIVIVEGYAVNGSPDRQYVVSRARAELVRRYLEMHYHLDHFDVGAIAMKGQPLAQTGKTIWDGAAIALLPVTEK